MERAVALSNDARLVRALRSAACGWDGASTMRYAPEANGRGGCPHCGAILVELYARKRSTVRTFACTRVTRTPGRTIITQAD